MKLVVTMKSIVMLLVTLAPCLSLNPLQELDKAQLKTDQEICKKLNETIYSIVFNRTKWMVINNEDLIGDSDKSYMLPGNYLDVEGKNAADDDLITKEFSFYYSAEKPVFNMTTKLPRNANVSELMSDGTVKNIFPVKYHIEEFYVRSLSGEVISFFLIQGERCKAKYNENIFELTNRRCWSAPSFCRGSKEQCVQNDDENSLCYDSSTGEGKKKNNPEEIHYSLEIGERIYWKSQLRREADNWNSRSDPLFYRWDCDDLGERVTCSHVDDQVNPLENENLFNSDQELCKNLTELNSPPKRSDEQYERASFFDETYVLPGNLFDVEGREDDSENWVTKNFVFNYRMPFVYGHENSVLNISTKIPKNASIKDLMSDGTVRNILPVNYRITKFYTKDYVSFYLIEGERCKAQYDRETKKLVNRRCWKTPSFCRGFLGNCILNDDEDSLCYDVSTQEGKRPDKPEDIHYSVNIGERVYWNVHMEPGISDYWLIRWNCKEEVDYVFCDYIDDGDRPHITVLKTLSGYSG